MHTSVLPPNPSLEQLKGQAKRLLQAFRAADPAVARRFRQGLAHLSKRTDSEVFAARISLKDALQVMAREYGFADWAVLKAHIQGGVQYFADYRWSKRLPVGVDELTCPEGRAHVKFVRRTDGIHVEQYDERGGFVRLCHHPADDQWAADWRKERLGGDTSAVMRASDGSVVRYEKYRFHAERCADGPLVSTEIFTVEGRLIEVQEAHGVSHTAYDLHIKDGCGKFKGVVHHAAVDRGEPYDISEDWVV